MGNQDEIIKFYKKRIEPYVAIFILAFLVTGLVLLYQDNQLKKEISKNCGWETEQYKCYCDKGSVTDFEYLTNGSFVDAIKNVSIKMDGKYP